MATDTSTRPPTISEAIAEAKKKWDLRVGSLNAMADRLGVDDVLTTGNLAIDHIIGVEGLPLGRSIELYGPPSCGKSTTAMQTAVGAQRKIIAAGTDEVILYLDFEHAIDLSYARKLGLNPEHPSFMISQPDFFEQGANAARLFISTGKTRLVIFDSVAAMTPEAAFSAETGGSQGGIALQARLMSEFMKPLNSEIHKQRTCAVFLNHIMELIDMGAGKARPGPKRTGTPGGRALKFYASIRIEYQQIKQIKGTQIDLLTQTEKDTVEANQVRVRVTKNKVAPPFKECEVRVRYGRGFDNFWSAVQVLIGHKAIVNSGGYYYWERSPELVPDAMSRQASGSKRPYIRGESSLLEFADEQPEWRAAVIEKAAKLVRTEDTDFTPEPVMEQLNPADLMAGQTLETVSANGASGSDDELSSLLADL